MVASDNRHLTISRQNEYITISRGLARTILYKHLHQLDIAVRTFQSSQDPEWFQYCRSTKVSDMSSVPTLKHRCQSRTANVRHDQRRGCQPGRPLGGSTTASTCVHFRHSCTRHLGGAPSRRRVQRLKGMIIRLMLAWSATRWTDCVDIDHDFHLRAATQPKGTGQI